MVKIIFLLCPLIAVQSHRGTEIFNMKMIKSVRSGIGGCSPEGHSCSYYFRIDDVEYSISKKESESLMKQFNKRLDTCLK